MTERCPWKIKWGIAAVGQCEKPPHLPGDTAHSIKITQFGDPGTTIIWSAGDRREYQGDWPGLCTGKTHGCVLPGGHHGRCAV